MAKIAAKPVLFKAPVSVGDDEYTAHLNQAQFEPTQPTSTWTDLDGKSTNFGGDSSWTLQLAGAQDWETVNSLSHFLIEHEGEEIEVTIDVPGGTWAGTVIAAAVTIGGTINTPAAFSKTLQVNGKPEFTPGA
ncbi:hypothetical protein E4V99_13995 [Microbacterium sp. dk485]|uniref:hypothetical protein n=1 Tax=Microbacterium sp. dk485 TaxID=2560021 RepID=UPI001073E733|nr:hypothetical protein [Microbacterium sp. dk485]TFV82041.1 hypothetical protein E4V99_13995 [Microbacterium sp. dk485]